MTATATLDALPQLQVRYRALLGIMVLPILLGLVIIADRLVMGGIFQDFIQQYSNDIAYSSLLLSLPHIVASLTTFADREYITAYRTPLTRGIALCLVLAVAVPYIFGLHIAMLVMAFYTVYHNYMQQYGISLMMMRQPPTLDYQIMRWSTLAGAGIGYVYALIPQIRFLQDNFYVVVVVTTPLVIAALICMVRFIRTNLKNPDHTRIGLWYFGSNMFVMLLCYFMLVGGYPLLAVITARIVHDYTALWIYMVHDQNRNRKVIHNPIYYIPKKLGIPPLVACVPIAILISWAMISASRDMFAIVVVITFCNFLHYYIEGYMWKRGTLHRQNAPFAY